MNNGQCTYRITRKLLKIIYSFLLEFGQYSSVTVMIIYIAEPETQKLKISLHMQECMC